MPSSRRYKNGRPTKRTPALEKTLFDAIKEGVPFKLACMAAGITYECFNQWRQKDPDFDRQVDELVAKPAIDLFKVIRQQAPETWQAGAWALERRFPEMFAKAEAQLRLNVLNQTAVLNGNGAGGNIEKIVVSDLEFVGLRRHPAYTHQPSTSAIDNVPFELGGSLLREGHANVSIISESQKADRSRRIAETRARTVALFEAHQAREVANSPPPPTEQAAEPSSAPDVPKFAEKSPEAELPPNIRKFFESDD